MKRKILTIIFQILLGILIVTTVFVAFYLLPILQKEMSSLFPQEAPIIAKPVYIICEALLFLFLLGIFNIFYLIHLFQKKRTFSKTFTRGLDILSYFCLLAVLGLGILFYILFKVGGPGPGPSLLLVGTSVIILILAVVFALWKTIIKEGMAYKEDVELTI